MSIIQTKGVDISAHNGNINLAKVKEAGYKWVMIKCGIGDNIKSQDDSQFEANVKKAEKLGMPWGVYIYSYALNKSQAKSEVKHVKRLLKGKKPTLPIAFDMEDADHYKSNRNALHKGLITEVCSVFLSEIKKAGYYPILYTGKYWLDGYDGVSGLIDKSVWSKYDIWLASWTNACTYKGKNLGIWQYGGEQCYYPGEKHEPKNSIPGVGVIDKDMIYKDYPTIIKNGGYNNWKKPKPKKVKFKANGALYATAYKDLVGGASKPKVNLQKGSEVEWVSDDKYGWSKVKYVGKTYYTLNGNLSKVGLSKCKTVTLPKECSGFKVTDKNAKGSSVKFKKGAKVKAVCVIEKGTYKNWTYIKIKDKKYYVKAKLV
jgi:GH25 family lysozyme M1 (1,4-beta-N-acetylmuramidase)